MASLRDIKRKTRSAVFALTLCGVASLTSVAAQPVWAQEQKINVPFIVLAPDGAPIENASIKVAYKAQLPDSTRSGTRAYSTDGKGQLEFLDAVPNSSWEFTFWLEGVGFATVKDYKIAQAPTDAKTVRLQPGKTLKVRCVERVGENLKPLGSIRVIARHLDLQNGTIASGDLVGYEWYYARSRDGDGICEFAGIPQGTYILQTGDNAAFNSSVGVVQLGKTSSEETVVLSRGFNSTINLKITDSDNQPIVGKTFRLRTDYAPEQDSQLYAKERLSAAEVAQWFKNNRSSPSSYPFLERTFQTGANGEAAIYPMEAGRWRLSLIGKESDSDNDTISNRVFVELANGETKSAILQLKPNVN